MDQSDTLPPPEELLDEAIARNEASIIRIQFRIQKLCETLDHIRRLAKTLPGVSVGRSVA